MCLDRFSAEHFAFHLNLFVKEDFIMLLEERPVSKGYWPFFFKLICEKKRQKRWGISKLEFYLGNRKRLRKF